MCLGADDEEEEDNAQWLEHLKTLSAEEKRRQKGERRKQQNTRKKEREAKVSIGGWVGGRGVAAGVCMLWGLEGPLCYF
jgi:hypothetical protein